MSLGRVILAPPERKNGTPCTRSILAVEAVRRAKVILMLAAGSSYSEISQRLACTDRYISRWKLRFKQERLGGLDSRYRGAAYRRRTAQTEARILELTRRGPRMARPIGAVIVWRRSLGSVNRRSVGCGGNLDFNPTVRVATWPVMIRSLRRRLPTSSGCISNRPCMPLSSALTRRVLSKLLTDWTRSCHFLLAALSGMVSSITAMAPFHSTAL